MKAAPLLLGGILLVAGLGLAVALPRGAVPSLLDLTAERLPAPPEIRLLTPTDGEGVGSVVRVSGVASGTQREVIDVQVRVDGARWESAPLAARGALEVPFEADVSLDAGDHLVEARAWDGEAYSLPARVTVRRDAPTLVLAEPADGDAVDGPLTVSGTVKGSAHAVVVEAAGVTTEALILPGGVWRATLDLPAGVHEVRATARAAVPSLPQSARVSVGGPALALTAPREGASYGEAGDLACGGGCILFAGTARDAERVDVTVDGRAAGTAPLLADSAWTYRLPVLGLANGTHRVSFLAIGADGARSVEQDITFLARTPITLRIDGDTEPAPTGTLLGFAVTGERAQTVTWTLDGVEIGHGPSVRFALPVPGDHQLVARTAPEGGTSATATLALHALNRPPAVAFDALPVAVGASLRLEARSEDPDGQIVQHHWEFGDGTSTTTWGANVTHRFGTRGLLVVNVTAVDDRGAAAQASQLVFVANVAPLANFSWDPAEPSILDVVNFTDASRDLDGRLAARTWILPDGSRSAEAAPSFRFASPGPHAVTLHVLDDEDAPGTLTRVVHVRNLPPVAAFQAVPALPRADEDVVLTDLSLDPEGRLVSWRWELGDGTFANTSGVLHRYADPGLYEVNLTVTDHLGANATFRGHVRVLDSDPTVRAVLVEPPEPSTTDDVRFTALGSDRDGAIVSHLWDFGDGATSTDAAPTHRYARSGAYHANVTVFDEAGLQATFPFTVVVRNTPPTAALRLVDGGYAAYPSVLLAEASDLDGRAALFRFDADGDGQLDCESPLPRCVFTYEAPGVYGARVSVSDDEGADSLAELPVEMLAPPSHLVPPRVTLEWPVEGSTLRGDQLVRGEATGVRPVVKVEMQLQQGAWAYSGAEDPWRVVSGTGPWSALLDTRALADGDYDLVVRATDEGGGLGSARIPVSIRNGARPSEVTLQLLDTPEVLHGDVVLRGSAFHPQGVTSVRWRVDEAPWRFVSSSPLAFSLPLEPRLLGPGEHVLEVEAFHGPGESASTLVRFEVPGEAPALVVDEPPPATAFGLIRATGRIVGVGHAQWRLDHGLWKDLPPGDWVLAEETQNLLGGRHTLHLRAIGPEGLTSEVRSYAMDVVNPDPWGPYHAPAPAGEQRSVPAPSLATLLALACCLACAFGRPSQRR